MGAVNPFNGNLFKTVFGGGIDTVANGVANLAAELDKQNFVNKVNSSDSSLLTSDEVGSILGGIDRGNYGARSVTYEEIKKKAQEQYNAGVAEKNRQLQTQGKQAAILTGGRGVDFANQPLAEGRQLRGVAGA